MPFSWTDFGADKEILIACDERAPFAALKVLRLMEADATEVTERATPVSIVGAQQCLSGVLDHEQPLGSRDFVEDGL